MTTVTVNQFREHLRHYVEETTKTHEVLTVSRRNGKDFVVMSSEDWQSIEETLYVLQNTSLVEQIQKSFETHGKNQGYQPGEGEFDEINHL